MPIYQAISQKLFRDKNGKLVLGQFPNLPLWGWIITTILSAFIAQHQAHNALSFLARAFLFTWAYLEARNGVNLFRRLLGCIVLAIIIVSAFTE